MGPIPARKDGLGSALINLFDIGFHKNQDLQRKLSELENRIAKLEKDFLSNKHIEPTNESLSKSDG